MISKIIEFEIRPEIKDMVIEAIENFSRTVHVSEPGCRFYVSFQDMENPNKFIHIMCFENEGAELKHKSAGYTQDFVGIINKSCKKKPVYKNYINIGGL